MPFNDLLKDSFLLFNLFWAHFHSHSIGFHLSHKFFWRNICVRVDWGIRLLKSGKIWLIIEWELRIFSFMKILFGRFLIDSFKDWVLFIIIISYHYLFLFLWLRHKCRYWKWQYFWNKYLRIFNLILQLYRLLFFAHWLRHFDILLLWTIKLVFIITTE